MRIYGNRQILTVPSQAVRPTPARVREAVFNIWRDRLPDCRWLDLCAGNGSMGAEALCRGAASVTGVEKWGKAIRVVQQNWQQLAASNQSVTILRGEICKTLPKLQGQQFDLIYFDPPYASDLYDPVLKAIALLGLLHPDGELAAEYSPRYWTPLNLATLEQYRQKQYGNTAIMFYRLTLK
ncbi:MAG: 16S rRNA (guanine(966)-N(2))-methyltransferase RsmD [Spirulina sp. SIO3F2]|nr:16S rRNA (guanine(966)-N(2))-methyltransferase RsmD [Spirulina sp. SIO3F2]